MKTIIINNVKIQYDDRNIKIIDSHNIESESEMEYILLLFKRETGYISRRTRKSWVKEWKAHNRLYKLGLFKSHTTDCDLEENEKWYRLFAYQILGI